jgi:hypothetical protein
MPEKSQVDIEDWKEPLQDSLVGDLGFQPEQAGELLELAYLEAKMHQKED